MKISRVETVTIRHSWGEPHEGVTRDWPLVLIHTDGGPTGIGRGGNIDTIKHDLAPQMTDRPGLGLDLNEDFIAEYPVEAPIQQSHPGW